MRVFVNDDTGIEQPLRVEETLDAAHDIISLLTPFLPDEWSHITSCTMFRLQRTVILVDYQSLHVIHEPLVSSHLLVVVKILVNDEMIIPFQSMPIDAGIVLSMTRNELLKFFGRMGEVFYLESDILCQAGCARFTSTADRREDSTADSPELTIDLRVLRERHGNI